MSIASLSVSFDNTKAIDSHHIFVILVGTPQFTLFAHFSLEALVFAFVRRLPMVHIQLLNQTFYQHFLFSSLVQVCVCVYVR